MQKKDSVSVRFCGFLSKLRERVEKVIQQKCSACGYGKRKEWEVQQFLSFEYKKIAMKRNRYRSVAAKTEVRSVDRKENFLALLPVETRYQHSACSSGIVEFVTRTVQWWCVKNQSKEQKGRVNAIPAETSLKSAAPPERCHS